MFILRWSMRIGIIWAAISFCTSFANAEISVRFATYNIKFLSTNVQNQGDRLQKLRQVIELLEADVIGLQEINDRASLRLLFPESDWHIVIDDDSGENQDLALVVRKPLEVVGLDADMDADDRHFLFPTSANNNAFPDRRDVLRVAIRMPTIDREFTVLVLHGKSRFGGRHTTDPRRELASTMLVNLLERDFDGQSFILLGDFNDSPDDKSLNILETGNPNALGGMESDPGAFLINLTEPLYAAGHVSHGRKSNELTPDGLLVDTIDPGSRLRNHNGRGTDLNTGDILFDQILIPHELLNNYVQGSIAVFNNAVGARGNDTTRASDHLPVFADFVFEASAASESGGGFHIVSLLPNPQGSDNGREKVSLRNSTSSQIDLTNWRLRDRAGNVFPLSGVVAANQTRTIVMTNFSMPLNNSGDEVLLIQPDGQVRHRVEYTRSQVQVTCPHG